MTASTKPHFVNFKGASKPCTKQRSQCPPRYVCRGLFLGRPGLAVASSRRINICPLGLILGIAVRVENPRRQEEGNWLGVAKQMCKIPSHSKKIWKGKRSSCGLKSNDAMSRISWNLPTLLSDGQTPCKQANQGPRYDIDNSSSPPPCEAEPNHRRSFLRGGSSATNGSDVADA
jgi:hypothetical protein